MLEYPFFGILGLLLMRFFYFREVLKLLHDLDVSKLSSKKRDSVILVTDKEYFCFKIPFLYPFLERK